MKNDSDALLIVLILGYILTVGGTALFSPKAAIIVAGLVLLKVALTIIRAGR